jgi:hypothetical protein
MRAAGRVSRVDGRRETIRASSPEPPMTYPGDTKKAWLTHPTDTKRRKSESTTAWGERFSSDNLFIDSTHQTQYNHLSVI